MPAVRTTRQLQSERAALARQHAGEKAKPKRNGWALYSLRARIRALEWQIARRKKAPANP
jgi:hypothetical protein